MIHYHGTPVGGSSQDSARFLRNRHALVPFIYQDDMAAVAEFCSSFILDNSAFTVWNSGGELDIPGYALLAETWYWHPAFDWALIPDIIDGSESANDLLIRDWPRHLRGKGVPVWHLHESLDRLERLVSEWPTVALGSSGKYRTPGTDAWWNRMAYVMAVACDPDGRPKTRLHGLRMMNPKIFTHLPLRRFCVITGGEPALQFDLDLARALRWRGFFIAIETNGTRKLEASVDWLCVSPKAGASLALYHADELKLVFPQAGAMPDMFDQFNASHFWLSPMDGPNRMANTALAAAYCRDHPKWRLAIQAHKTWNIP